MEELYQSPYLTPQHYEHRSRIRRLPEQKQQQQVVQSTGATVVGESVVLIKPIIEEQIPFGD